MTSLDISNNKIGELVLPNDWKVIPLYSDSSGVKGYKHANGREQTNHPGQPEGAIALAGAIKTNGALTSLNVSDNSLANYGRDMSGIKAFAAAITECK